MRGCSMIRPALAFCLPGALCAAPEGWSEDFAHSCALAASRGSCVLVEFTGSDWCAPCRQLRREVLPSAAFAAFAAQRRLVLVELDFPAAEEKVAPEQRAARRQLAELYGVRAFPTLLLLDAAGLCYGRVEGARPVEEVLEALQGALRTKEEYEARLTAAEGLEGAARAAALVHALQALPRESRELCAEVMAEISALDPEDTLGYRRQVRLEKLYELQLQEFRRVVREAMANKELLPALRSGRVAALALLGREDLVPRIRQLALDYVSRAWEADQQPAEAVRYAEEALAADPESPEAGSIRERLQLLRRAAGGGK